MRYDVTVTNPDGQSGVLPGGFTAVSPLPPPDGDSHAYFDELAARPDCFTSRSLRDAAQVDAVRVPKSATSLHYVYPTDPDPRRQDGMRVRIVEGAKGADGQIRILSGPSNGASVFVTFDVWYGLEWRTSHSKLSLHKETPMSLDRGGDRRWIGMRSAYNIANAHVHNQPPGGPYVTMLYGQAPKGLMKTSAGWYQDTDTRFPRLNLSYTAGKGESRNYNEGMAPVDTTKGPEGAETGLVGERWTRIFHYCERAPEEDWPHEVTGELMLAYKWSYWLADTVRDPIRMLNEAVIGIPVSDPKHVSFATLANHGAGQSNNEALYIGRGPLTAYYRNFVVLHGTPKAEAMALLQKPVA